MFMFLCAVLVFSPLLCVRYVVSSLGFCSFELVWICGLFWLGSLLSCRVDLG